MLILGRGAAQQQRQGDAEGMLLLWVQGWG